MSSPLKDQDSPRSGENKVSASSASGSESSPPRRQLPRKASLCGCIAHRTFLGYSFGGFLAPRAAAFERRVAAVICIDGLFDAFTGSLPPELKLLLDAREIDDLNRAVALAS
jgi:hypothetical protein